MSKLKIMIADIFTREREVEIEDTCPKCNKKLTEVSLTGWEYQDQKRLMRVQGDRIEFDEDDLPESGEAFISYVSLHCECDHVLVAGEEGSLPEKIDG